jgi:hypothetical protein
MTQKLAESQSEVANYRRTLEEKVTRRRELNRDRPSLQARAADI